MREESLCDSHRAKLIARLFRGLSDERIDYTVSEAKHQMPVGNVGEKGNSGQLDMFEGQGCEEVDIDLDSEEVQTILNDRP